MHGSRVRAPTPGITTSVTRMATRSPSSSMMASARAASAAASARAEASRTRGSPSTITTHPSTVMSTGGSTSGSACTAAVTAGRLTVKIVPFPGADSTSMVPSMPVTMSWTVASPMPVLRRAHREISGALTNLLHLRKAGRGAGTVPETGQTGRRSGGPARHHSASAAGASCALS